jgi:hypothetical protein
MALDGTHRPLEDLSQSFHLGETLPALVIGVVGQRAVGRDDLSRYTGGYQGFGLWNPGKARTCHSSPFCGGCASAILDGKIRQSGGPWAKVCTAASLLLCQRLYLSRPGFSEPASSSQLASLSQLLLPATKEGGLPLSPEQPPPEPLASLGIQLLP